MARNQGPFEFICGVPCPHDRGDYSLCFLLSTSERFIDINRIECMLRVFGQSCVRNVLSTPNIVTSLGQKPMPRQSALSGTPIPNATPIPMSPIAGQVC